MDQWDNHQYRVPINIGFTNQLIQHDRHNTAYLSADTFSTIIIIITTTWSIALDSVGLHNSHSSSSAVTDLIYLYSVNNCSAIITINSAMEADCFAFDDHHDGMTYDFMNMSLPVVLILKSVWSHAN